MTHNIKIMSFYKGSLATVLETSMEFIPDNDTVLVMESEEPEVVPSKRYKVTGKEYGLISKKLTIYVTEIRR